MESCDKKKSIAMTSNRKGVGAETEAFRANSWLASSPLALGLFDAEFRKHDQGWFPSVMVINGSIVR